MTKKFKFVKKYDGDNSPPIRCNATSTMIVVRHNCEKKDLCSGLSYAFVIDAATWPKNVLIEAIEDIERVL